jgi:hypothetical protein
MPGSGEAVPAQSDFAIVFPNHPLGIRDGSEGQSLGLKRGRIGEERNADSRRKIEGFVKVEIEDAAVAKTID